MPADKDDWRHKAACAGKPALFTSDDPHDIAAAKNICNTQCEVRDECLKWALDNKEPHFVIGGMTDNQRARIRNRVTV